MPSGVWAVLVAGLAGQLAAALVGIVPWPVLGLSAALLVVGGRLGLRADERLSIVLRRGASVVAVGLALVCLPGLVGATDPLQIKGNLGLLLIGVQVCQSVGWRHPRELRAGLVTALGVLVLAASYAPDVLVGFPLVVGWVAVLLALGELHGSRRRQLLPAVGVALVLGLVAFLLVPLPGAAGLRSRLAGDNTAAAERTRTGEGALLFSQGVLDLRLRGALTTDPVLSVPADAPDLWRATTFDAYDGTSWSRAVSATLPGGPTYLVAAPRGPVRTDRVTLRTDPGGAVWSPGRLITVQAAGVAFALASDDGDVQLGGLSGSYVVTSEVPVTDPSRLRSRVGTDATDPRWRELPVALPARVRDLGRQLTAGAGSRWDAAEAISNWLRGNATYRLDSPVPAPGADAVDQFLFVDHTGFCEQFASAEVVLLRSVGIPARLVTGLAYGVPEGDQRTFRVEDLHAWVEVWVPGAGWVASDPTAGVRLARGGRSTASLRTGAARTLSAWLHAATRLPGGRPGLAVGLLAAAGFVVLVVSRRPRRRRTAEGGATATGPALAAFLRLDARLGERRRRPGESLRELRGRLDPDPELGEALNVVEQECYAPTAPDARSAVDVLDRY